MSENCEIFEKKSLLEKTGCGRGAVAPAARNSRKFREFSRKLRFLTNRDSTDWRILKNAFSHGSPLFWKSLTKNLFSQGEVWVSPGKFSGPYQKPIFSRGWITCEWLAGWAGLGWLAGLAGTLGGNIILSLRKARDITPRWVPIVPRYHGFSRNFT